MPILFFNIYLIETYSPFLYRKATVAYLWKVPIPIPLQCHLLWLPQQGPVLPGNLLRGVGYGNRHTKPKSVLLTTVSIFFLLCVNFCKLFNFYKQYWSNMVSIQKIIFCKKKPRNLNHFVSL